VLGLALDADAAHALAVEAVAVHGG